MILYVVWFTRSEFGVTVKVRLSLDATGESLILIHVLKLLEETWKVPEHDVSEVFVVTVDVSTGSESVIEIFEFVFTDVSESAGDVDETVMFIEVNPVGVVYWSRIFSPESDFMTLLKRTL